MRPKTAASVAVLSLMLATGAAMAQTTPSPSTDGAPPATQDKAPPAAQLPPEKMPAEKVMPSPRTGAAGDAITTQATNTVLGTDLIGKTAYGADQKKIGTINDVILKQDGTGIEGVVVGVGGFLGLGEHNVALKMDKFSFRPSESGRTLVVLNATREELEKAPAFKTKADLEAEAARNAPRPTPATPGTPSPSR